MKVVLADIEEKALEEAQSALQEKGADTIAVLADVSKLEDVQNLAKQTIDQYKQVDLLFNNAGVSAGASIWESTRNDCNWVIGVNLWGVINCVREFIPVMIDQNTSCHIINTSSIAGFATFHPSALYHLTKHGIVALSEQLYHDFAIRGLDINISVICPGFVNTKIMDVERSRPEKYSNDPSQEIRPPDVEEGEAVFRQMIEQGMSPIEVARIVFEAIKEEKLFIFTHPEMQPLIEGRMNEILQGRNPILPAIEGP